MANYEELRDHWRAMIKGYLWDHFATLEFPAAWYIHRPEVAFRRLQAFIDSFTRESGGPIPWFAVAERFADGSIHLHVLLFGTAGFSVEQLKKRWERRNGSAEFRVYDPTKGGAEYTVKRVPGGTDWLTSDGFESAMRRLGRRVIGDAE